MGDLVVNVWRPYGYLTTRYMCQAPLNAQELLDQIRDEYGPGQLTHTDGRKIGLFSNVTVPLGTYNYTPNATGDTVTLDEILNFRLPNCHGTGSSGSVNHLDKDRQTHATEVLPWDSFSADVGTLLQSPEVLQWKSRTYPLNGSGLGNGISTRIPNEDMAVVALLKTSCESIDFVFMHNNKNFAFIMHPTRSKPDPQVAEIARVPVVELDPDELIARDAPHICLCNFDRAVRSIVLTVECKTQFRLAGVERYHLADIWTTWKNTKTPHGDLKKAAAYNAVHALSQELGYMSRRGHRLGLISTFYTTWVVKADGKGTVWVSPGIPHSANANETGEVTVTQALLFASLSNIESRMEPYTTAKTPGGQPISRTEAQSRRTRAVQALAQGGLGEQPEVNNPGPSSIQQQGPVPTAAREVSLPAAALYLTCRLAPSVFLGCVKGAVAAVRLATEPAAQDAAKQEVAAYERLADLQGISLPRLLAFGHITGKTAYFVATEFLEGEPWDETRQEHRELASELVSALSAIHARGVLHGDVHDGNILITPGRRVVMLDFAAAKVRAPASETDAEMRYLCSIITVPVSAH